MTGGGRRWVVRALVVAVTALVLTAPTSVLAPMPGPVLAAAPCLPADPVGCTLRQLATPAGFRIGATAEADQVVPGPYATTLADEFNAVTPENALKWYAVQPAPGDWRFGAADAVVGFAADHGLEVRGHTLVWAQDTYTPAWVRAISDPAVLDARVDEQIATVMGRYSDRIHRWDVVNEPLATLGTGPSDSVYWRVLGPTWVADAFRSAHAVDPTAELWLNEYGTDWVPGKHDALVSLVRGLVDDGVPIHGVGIQTHRLSPDGPDPAVFEAQLRQLTDLGVEVAITELDVPIAPTDADGPERQAAAYGRVVAACLAVPGCDEVTTWGVTDASTWLDQLGIFPPPTRPLLFDEQFRPKPAYVVVRDLLARAVPVPTTTTTATSTTAPVASTGATTTTAGVAPGGAGPPGGSAGPAIPLAPPAVPVRAIAPLAG